MKTDLFHAPIWSTSAFSDTVDTSPIDLSALGEHLERCQGAHGPWFALQCAAETVNGFVVARFATTLVVLAVLLIGVVNWVS